MTMAQMGVVFPAAAERTGWAWAGGWVVGGRRKGEAKMARIPQAWNGKELLAGCCSRVFYTARCEVEVMGWCLVLQLSACSPLGEDGAVRGACRLALLLWQVPAWRMDKIWYWRKVQESCSEIQVYFRPIVGYHPIGPMLQTLATANASSSSASAFRLSWRHFTRVCCVNVWLRRWW
jgi:hypothetical protein